MLSILRSETRTCCVMCHIF